MLEGYTPCIMFYNDGLVKEGFALPPNRTEDYVKFKTDMSSYIPELVYSKELDEIIFRVNSKEIHFRTESIFKGIEKKSVSKRKFWMAIVKDGYMTLYYGKQPISNGPSQNIWYCKKTDDPAAYYIVSAAAPGYMTISFGYEQTFTKNASEYFKNYEELAEKIKNSEYKFKDLLLIVDLYNEWYEKNK
jgi:hypothetical protein